MPNLSFVIVSAGREFEAALESSAGIEILGHVDHLDDLVQTVEEKRPDALLVGLDDDPQAVFDALGKLLSPRPLLFFHGPDNSQLILRAMRLGAREYIAPAPDEKKQLLVAVTRASQEVDGSAHAQQAPLIALIGAKGGVGTTFVACQLGAALARLGGRTALVDGHLHHGDVALYMDLSPPYTFASLATRSEPIDATYLKTALMPHPSGVEVLAAPKNPEEADAVDVRCIEGVAGLLREEFDWVIWDTSRDFDDRNLFILDQANPIVLITTPDVPAMNHTRMQLDLLRRLGQSDGEIRIVVNRTDAGASVSARDAKEFLDRPVDATVPSDYRRASTCVNEGRTLQDVAPRCSLAQGMNELALLAHYWCDRSAPRPRKGLLDRLRGR